jgi:hypothetical protein
LLRALASYAGARPRSETARLVANANAASHERIMTALLAPRSHATRSDERSQAAFALSVAFRALRDGVLRGENADAWPHLSDRELADQLTQMVVAYVDFPTPLSHL